MARVRLSGLYFPAPYSARRLEIGLLNRMLTGTGELDPACNERDALFVGTALAYAAKEARLLAQEFNDDVRKDGIRAIGYALIQKDLQAIELGKFRTYSTDIKIERRNNERSLTQQAPRAAKSLLNSCGLS